jgi:2-methylcitrate dehydratase PrpD
MSVVKELSANIVETNFGSLDKEAVERAKWRVIDAVGCCLAGVNAAGCPIMLQLVKRWGGAAESSVLVSGLKAPAHQVAMLNSLMARSFDFEPVEAEGENKTSPAHISGTTVPTSLSMAEMQASSGSELITALVLGDDLASRLGVASGFDFSGGWDNTGTINMFGATAIAGKLLKLNAVQMQNAFGIVVNQLAGSMAGVWDQTMTFKLPIALSSHNGIVSAELAQQGFTGLKDAFLGHYGYFALYCRNPETESLTKDLGKRFYADCIIKPHSACRATHPSIDCALQLAAANNINIEEIEEITLFTSAKTRGGFTGQDWRMDESPQINGAFSLRYTVATALLRKSIKPEYFEGDYIRDPQIKKLIECIKLEEIAPSKIPSSVELRIKLKNGKIITAHTDIPRGHIRLTPLSQEEIRAKFRSNAAFSGKISRVKTEKALGMMEKLETLKNVRDLIPLLVSD